MYNYAKERKVVFKGRRIKLITEDHLLPNGRIAYREYIEFPQSVAVLPILSKDELILLYQYRAPLRKWIYEVPAGIIEEGEEPEEAARRELEEETGYIAKKLSKAFTAYLAPGYSNELMHAFIAEDLVESKAHPEPYEVIRVVKFSMKEVIKMIRSGKIDDMKTIALILYYLHINKNY